MKELYIIRGIPGSGKSTFAKKLATALQCNYYEADMFFCRDGNYVFDRTKLRVAHQWCLNMVESELVANKQVIVSNTFTTKRELLPYFDLARAHDIVPTVLIATGSFKNIHNVPEEHVQRAAARFDYSVSF